MSVLKAHTEQYYLDIKFGTSEDTSENPTRLLKFLNPIDELYIIQDLNRFLPTFRLKIQDIEGAYSSLKPYDNRQDKIRIAIGRDGLGEGATVFDFDIYRRFPSSDSVYDIEGTLQINNFFRPDRVRGFSGTVKDTLTSIACELGVEEVDISPSLEFKKDIVQPSCSNAELLGYLRDNLIGKQQESPYFCFIVCKNKGQGMKRILVFRSLKELYKEKVKYTFSDIITASYDEDAKEIYYPILDFKAYDNYKLLETSGCKKAGYGYFDYDNDMYVVETIGIRDNEKNEDNYYSLTQYFSINQDCSDDSVIEIDTGRSNDFTPDFKAKTKGMFFRKINDLSKFWITTWGLEDICPGDIVRLEFLRDSLNMLLNQYHGFWMVERVAHTFGQAFGTRLLLTRNGINSIEDTTLELAEIWKRT